MCINNEQDILIDKIKSRLQRGVSPERLINQGETHQIGKAVVCLRDHNVQLATELLRLCQRYDELYASTQGKSLKDTTP